MNIELKDDQYPYTYIDHDRLIVRAIVYDDEGFFYFVKTDRDDEFGRGIFIETSGGGVEEGEELLGALKRELKEELGADVEIITELGIVSDCYNLIHRHNISHYYLCKAIRFGERTLTEREKSAFDLSVLKLKYDDALRMYEKCAASALGTLLMNRELPILKRAFEILNGN